MIAQTSRLDANLDGALEDPNAFQPLSAGAVAPPPAPTAAPAPTPTTGGFTAPTTTTAAPTPPPPAGGVETIGQLPDGAGGTVPVPPTPLAPPDVVGAAPSFVPGGVITTTDTPDNHPWGTGAAGAPAAPAAPGVELNDVGRGPIGQIPTTPAAPAPWESPLAGAPSTLPTFTPDNNYIDKTIMPGQTPRGNRETAAGDAGLGALDTAAPIVPGNDPRLLKFQGLSDEALNAILHGPNRLDLAKQYWDADVLGTQADYQHAMTDATDNAAAHGRIRSGILTNRYGDLEASREHDLTSMKSRYLADAATGTIADRERAYQAVADAERNAYGEGASNNAQLRTERQSRLDLIAQHFRNAQDEIARENDLAAQARGERTYQSQQDKDAIAQQVLGHSIETEDDQRAFDNAMRIWNAGNASNPADAYATAGAQASGEASGQQQSVAELMKLIAAMRNRPATAGA